MRKRIGMGIAAVALGGAALFSAASPASAAKVEVCVQDSDGIVVCCDGNIIWIMTSFPE